MTGGFRVFPACAGSTRWIEAGHSSSSRKSHDSHYSLHRKRSRTRVRVEECVALPACRWQIELLDTSGHNLYISHMSATSTLSIRVPLETRRWLERFAKRRGSAGMAATRILEEARRREDFPSIEFRDTRLGRVTFVHGTRVQVAFVFGQILGNPSTSADELAASFAWPQWKASGVMAYMEEFSEECRQEWEDLLSCEAHTLKRSLPNVEHLEFAEP